MTFVNEMIPKDDIVRFEVKEVDKTLRIGRAFSRNWIADRDRGVFVRLLSRLRSHPEMLDSRNISTWSMNYDEKIVFFSLEKLGTGKDDDGRLWNSWKYLGLEDGSDLLMDRDVFIDYIKEALTVYQFLGEHFADDFYLKFDANGVEL